MAANLTKALKLLGDKKPVANTAAVDLSKQSQVMKGDKMNVKPKQNLKNSNTTVNDESHDLEDHTNQGQTPQNVPGAMKVNKNEILDLFKSDMPVNMPGSH